METEVGAARAAVSAEEQLCVGQTFCSTRYYLLVVIGDISADHQLNKVKEQIKQGEFSDRFPRIETAQFSVSTCRLCMNQHRQNNVSTVKWSSKLQSRLISSSLQQYGNTAVKRFPSLHRAHHHTCCALQISRCWKTCACVKSLFLEIHCSYFLFL